MSDNQSLDEVLEELSSNEGRDYEGDRTYRVHIQTARSLIIKAYNLGEKQAKYERDTLTEALASLLETVEWVAEEHGVEVYADLCEAAGKACEVLEGISSGGKNIL